MNQTFQWEGFLSQHKKPWTQWRKASQPAEFWQQGESYDNHLLRANTVGEKIRLKSDTAPRPTDTTPTERPVTDLKTTGEICKNEPGCWSQERLETSTLRGWVTPTAGQSGRWKEMENGKKIPESRKRSCLMLFQPAEFRQKLNSDVLFDAAC